MSVRAIDENRDWEFGQGKQSYKTGNDEIAQMITTRVNSWFGDCFFAVLEGVDYPYLLEKGRKDELVQALSLVVLETQGVVAINSFEATLNGRALTINYDIATIYSDNFLGTIGVQNG